MIYNYRGKEQFSGNVMILYKSSMKGSVVWFQRSSPLGPSQRDRMAAFFPCWGFYFPLPGQGQARRRKDNDHLF